MWWQMGGAETQLGPSAPGPPQCSGRTQHPVPGQRQGKSRDRWKSALAGSAEGTAVPALGTEVQTAPLWAQVREEGAGDGSRGEEAQGQTRDTRWPHLDVVLPRSGTQGRGRQSTIHVWGSWHVSSIFVKKNVSSNYFHVKFFFSLWV